MLGQGAYAMVREAVHIESGYKVAIKIYDKYKLEQSDQIKQSVIREIKILSDMSDLMGQYSTIMKLYVAIDMPRQLFLIL